MSKKVHEQWEGVEKGEIRMNSVCKDAFTASMEDTIQTPVYLSGQAA